jgi:Short-chain dehydrogenases of various substrate specificities
MTGKVAVVTGGSRGIGRAIVQTLAEAGADVVIASRKLDACEAAAEQVRTSTGRRAVAIACHVGRWGDCDRLIAETLERAGRLDVLVNNAGMSPLYESLDSGERGTVRQDAGRQPEGPVPAGGPGRHAHGRSEGGWGGGWGLRSSTSAPPPP